MKREERRAYLNYLEQYILNSGKSISRIAYESTMGWKKPEICNIKKIFRELHPMDYKTRYPNAVNLLVRICYPKKRDYWGRKAEQKTLTIKEIAARKGEFIRRSRKLVNDSNSSDILDILDVILSLTNEDKQAIAARLDEKNDKANSLLLALSINTENND